MGHYRTQRKWPFFDTGIMMSSIVKTLLTHERVQRHLIFHGPLNCNCYSQISCSHVTIILLKCPKSLLILCYSPLNMLQWICYRLKWISFEIISTYSKCDFSFSMSSIREDREKRQWEIRLGWNHLIWNLKQFDNKTTTNIWRERKGSSFKQSTVKTVSST